MKKVFVLGAGITGLVTAWKLAKAGHEVTLIEKENQVGGLAGTVEWDGFKFDHGAHNFHTKHLELINFYQELLPEIFRERKNSVKLHIFGKLNKYPIVGAQVFFALNFFTMVRAMISFLFARTRAFLFGIPETEHLDEWITRRFGKVLYNIYFGPYLERVQKKSAHLLSSDIGLKKIPIFSLRQYIKRELLGYSKFHPEDVNTYKTFYCVNGYGEFSNFFLGELRKMENVTIDLWSPVEEIELTGTRMSVIRTKNRSYEVGDGDVISTLPLEVLINRIKNANPALVESALKLEYTKMRFFLIKVKRPSVMGLSWVNFNDPRFPYYRVSEEVHGEFNMTPPGCTALCFEIPL
ncbi:MAG: FAD-dependent oxidoreductase, partial [Bacteroidota bacterium]